jgi:hypothetical protein
MTPETHPPSRQRNERQFPHVLVGNRLRKRRRINQLNARKVAMPPSINKAPEASAPAPNCRSEAQRGTRIQVCNPDCGQNRRGAQRAQIACVSMRHSADRRTSNADRCLSAAHWHCIDHARVCASPRRWGVCPAAAPDPSSGLPAVVNRARAAMPADRRNERIPFLGWPSNTLPSASGGRRELGADA